MALRSRPVNPLSQLPIRDARLRRRCKPSRCHTPRTPDPAASARTPTRSPGALTSLVARCSQTNTDTVRENSLTRILLSQRSVKKIRLSIKAEYFGSDWANSQDQDRFIGVITEWKHKGNLELMVRWEGWDVSATRSPGCSPRTARQVNGCQARGVRGRPHRTGAARGDGDGGGGGAGRRRGARAAAPAAEIDGTRPPRKPGAAAATTRLLFGHVPTRCGNRNTSPRHRPAPQALTRHVLGILGQAGVGRAKL